MTLAQYGLFLLKRWKIIILCFILTGVGAAVETQLLTRYYQSSALVQIVVRSVNNTSDYNNLLASDQLVQTEVTLATSDPVLREVASHYPGLTAAQLAANVTATSKLNTQLFQITVQDPSPTRAAALANDIATTLIKQQQEAIQQSNTQSLKRFQQELDMTQKQIDEVATQIEQLQQQLASQGKIAVLQAQLNGLQQHYNQVQSALTTLELTEAQQRNFLQLVQQAQPNTQVVRPNMLLNTGAGLAVGLFLGILLALLLEQLDTRIPTPEAIAQLLSLPLLATVWRVYPSDSNKLINPTGDDLNAESYRLLRTNISFAGIDQPLQSLAVTSMLPQEGKSIVTTNLAIFMAKSGKNTLLVDADMRRPTQSKQSVLSSNKKGLSDAILAMNVLNTTKLAARLQHPLSSRTVLEQSVASLSCFSLEAFVHPLNIPHLWLMPAGSLPPNPPELLDSRAMSKLLDLIINSGFDVVIFDTPPVLGLSDVPILSSRVDGTIVVVDITQAKKPGLKKLKTQLTGTGVRIIGCVVNKKRHTKRDDVYYPYYHQQDKRKNSGEEDENATKLELLEVTEPGIPGIPAPPPHAPAQKTMPTVLEESLERPLQAVQPPENAGAVNNRDLPWNQQEEARSSTPEPELASDEDTLTICLESPVRYSEEAISPRQDAAGKNSNHPTGQRG